MPTSMNEVMEVIRRYAPKNFAPKVGMILGSGLSSLAERIEHPVSIPYQAIPGLHGGSVAGHASLMVMGNLDGVPVVCMRGRLHVYEGTPYEAIRHFVRIIKHMGCHSVLVTGAVGSLRADVGPGEIVMVDDHINFQPGNPLAGPNDESEGPRFFSLEDAYDVGLQDIMVATAERLNITLYRGVYISVLGPSFETPAEIRAFRMWGADVVGMSVVPEVMIARHCGLRVACLTAVTNLAAGMSEEELSHEGTLHFGEIGAKKLVKLIPEFVKDASEYGMV